MIWEIGTQTMEGSSFEANTLHLTKTKLYDTFYLNKQWRKLATVCVRRGLKQARVNPADLCLRRKTIGSDKLYAIDRGFAV